MVVVAVLVRGAIDDEGGEGSDGALTIICADELREACEALGSQVTVRVESPLTTLTALEAGDLDEDIDGWFTTNAWLEVLASRVPDAADTMQVAASTTPALAVEAERGDAIERLCTASTTWRCLGDRAGQPWGDLGGDPRWGVLRTGVPSADTATGLGVLASAAAGYFDATTFAANDFDVAFDSWLGALARSTSDADPLGTLVTRPGMYSAAAGTQARATAIARPLTLRPLEPELTILAVLIGFGRDPLPDPAPAGRALGEAGWTPTDDGGDPVALLKPGVLAALHTRWTEVVG